MMSKAWVLIVIFNGQTIDQGPRQTAMQCEASRRAFVQQYPMLEYHTFCQWRDAPADSPKKL